MPLANSNILPNSDARLTRENSLPTYEQATGSNPQGEIGEVTPSAPPLSTATQNYYVDDGRTSHHSTNYTPIPQAALRNPDIEQAFHDPSLIQHQDPVVRQMAETVLEECIRAKERRDRKFVVKVIGGVVGLFLFLIGVSISAAYKKH